MQAPGGADGQRKTEVELTDKLLESYKPALVFKNFVSLIYLYIF